MPFPEITDCILCETIRQEAGGRLAILGFYGVLPHLEIVAKDSPRTLTLLLITGPITGGTFRMSATITGPDEEFVGLPQDAIVTLQSVPREQGYFLASSFGEVVINQAGTYTFRVLADEQLVVTQTFSVFLP